MGNKIITEKDFWVCSGGLMPTQFQSTQPSTKRKDGAKYITKVDTATVSFADFSCRKLMLIMAILAALVAVATVATGGAALIAIGAIAGAAGAAFGAVLGSLLCGQMVAKVRKWDAGKENLVIMGIPAITGDHQMTCPLFGDKILFAPEIKTWGQAIAKGGANLIGGIMEGMMAGALIGVGGAVIGGGRAALTSGGMRGLGQAGLNFLKSAPSNIMSNFGQGVLNGVGFKAIDGATAWLNKYGDTGGASFEDFKNGYRDSAFGDAKAINNIVNTGGKMQDWVAVAMLLTPAPKGGRGTNNNQHASHIANPDGPHGNRPHPDSEGGNRRRDGDEATAPRSHTPDAPNNTANREGNAYAEGSDAPIQPPKDPFEGARQYETPFSPLSAADRKVLKEKLKNRTITKEEYKRLEWDRRFTNRRARGVSRFWANERKLLRDELPGTRDWTPEQRQDILNGKTPKFDGDPIEGHHRYNALDHPHLADNPHNIYPATDKEHLYRWHGGNYRNDTYGTPNNPHYPEEF
ncbi:hypothetical protein BBI01_01310 [Chryseobacterium artocarpi]|uniref:Tox-GHH domain-containing protein n=1 Tax=Chryseobacterium artocarpi TaxID=1414727 RepID=A0A1B8ZZV0_9FLAO|nr:hypothetical protein [Chryseobacterium artocarpi]OCA77129.1 hypothetical protein BBI01_01310 [Chryseobacterium artocarpi]